MAGRAVLDLAIGGECATCQLEFFQRFAARIVIGVDEFSGEPLGELGIRFDFKLEEEHVALNHRMVGRRAGPANPVINEPPVQVCLIPVAPNLLLVLLGYYLLPPTTV